MPNLDDLKPFPAPRLGGQVDYQQGPGGTQDATKVIPGCAILAQDVRFEEDVVATRYGNRTTMHGANSGVTGVATGIDVLEVIGQVNPGQIPVVFTDAGNLYEESPVGGETLSLLSTPFPLPANARMQTTQHGNRLHMAFGDGSKGLVPPLVLDGRTGAIMPSSQNAIGALWAKGLFYQIADLVRTGDGRWWRSTSPSTSVTAAQPPAWPSTNGFFNGSSWIPATVTAADGSQWEEWTPNCANVIPTPVDLGSAATITDNPGAGTIPSGQDVYIKLTYIVPSVGETSRSSAFVFANTGANDQITLGTPHGGGQVGIGMPRWLAEIILQANVFAPFFVNAYVAVVATGSPAPADSSYSLYAQFAVGSPIVVSSAPTVSARLTPGAQSGGFSNPTNAYDDNFTTFASASVATSYGSSANVQETWSGFAARGAGVAGLYLNVNWSAVLSANELALATIFYSLDGGSTFTLLDEASVSVGQHTASVAISNTQDLTKVQVHTSIFSNPPSSGTLKVYEIWMQTPTSPVSGLGTPALITLLTPNVPVAFQGENGSRYMIILREDAQGSLAAVDPNSALSVNIQGEVEVNILTIVRDSSGNVTATVTDVSQFAPGQTVRVIGCANDATFNGSFTSTSVVVTQAPEGEIGWLDSAHASASNDSTGVVTLPPQTAPIAFLPPGGSNDQLDIAAFTVVGEDSGGPYFYIATAEPNAPISTSIVSLQGESQVESAVPTITRFAGGEVQAKLDNISGFVTGMQANVAGFATDASFNELITIEGVEPGSGTGGTVTYTSAATAASSDTNGTITGIVEPGQVVAEVASVKGLAAGQEVAIINSSNTDFNQLGTIASISGNFVTLSMQATGSLSSDCGTLVVQQNLPTTSPAGSQSITSIHRDASGNVLAQIANLGGWQPGHVANVESVTDSTFDGQFLVTSAQLNPDGLSGVVGWSQTGQSVSTSSGGTLSSYSDIVINYDDSLLTSSADSEVTDQLTATGAPMASDICWIPSLAMMSYTTGEDDLFYFSNEGDPGTLSGDFSALEISDRKMSLAVAVRELESGEIVAMKTDGGYQVNISDLPPSQWNAPRRWDKYGPCCAAAIGLGSNFLAFPSIGEESGAYLYQAGKEGVEWISREYSNTWKRVNWAVSNTFYTEVDEQAKEVIFGVALDSNTQPSAELVCCYFSGWGEPEVLNRYGKLITNRSARKWTLRSIAAKTAKVVLRNSGLSDNRVATRQLLRGVNQPNPVTSYAISKIQRAGNVVTATLTVNPTGPFTTIIVTGVKDQSFNGTFGPATLANPSPGVYTLTWNQDGANSFSGSGSIYTTNSELRVWMVRPDIYDDDGIGIQSQYLPAFAQDEEGTTILKYGGFRAQVSGSGVLSLTLVSDDSTQVFSPTLIPLLSGKPTRFEGGLRYENEFASLLYSNQGVPSAFFRLLKHAMYAIPTQAGRRTA